MTFPIIVFMTNGDAVIVKNIDPDIGVTTVECKEKTRQVIIKFDEFKKQYSGYAILAKKLNRREQEERNGHWFFSAFKKSKWVYVQVMIAAMVSNFLSLTTSLFTMTVYDRIIPNGAFESLIALSIGVVIALGFDFLIKGLRAKFIDVASKRADLEISRRLFDRILNLTPNEQRQKTGAMAGTVREFETLREFFNSLHCSFNRFAFCILLYLRDLFDSWPLGLRSSNRCPVSDDSWAWDSTIFSKNNKRIC